jgi:hypothetical protein
MVEMLREDAEAIEIAWSAYPKNRVSVAVVEALRKALEKSK